MSASEGAPSEEELRAAYERELSRMTSADVIAQAVVSLLNIAALRLRGSAAEPGSERDLDQVRDALDGVSALLSILERTLPGEVRPLRDALSQMQLAYAAEVRNAGPAEPATPREPTPAGEEPKTPDAAAESVAQDPPAPEGDETHRPGPAESSGRLWVPGR